jgi:O-antigen ligase
VNGNGEPARRPGGAPRLAALVATAVGFLSVFTLGFPPAARDRLPILLLALALGLVSAWNPARGLVAFSFLFPLSGVGDRAFGGADAFAWPVLLFAGFAAGWTFRFLYDFDNVPDPSRLDGTLRALSTVWVVATIAAIARGRTLWALLHRLELRAVNVEGLLDSAAIRDSVLALAALASGVGFFFILRRAGAVQRERALRAMLAGCGLSGAFAVAERLGLPPGETNPFWTLTGRLSGGGIDPNALGLLSGLAFVASAAWLLAPGAGRRWPAAIAAAAAAGLVLSGSRSGLLLVAVGVLALVLAPGLPAARRLRLGLGLAAAGAVLVLAALFLQADRGGLARRLAAFMDPGISVQDRASSRPILWAGAVRLFGKYPIAGAGLGAFSWQLPNLLAEEGRALPMRDNPGSAYLQALAETGVIGFLLTAVFVAFVAREAFAALTAWREKPLGAGCGAAALGFLVALTFGSHWFAPDVSLGFFLFAACVARSRPSTAAEPLAAARLRRGAVLLYVVAAAFATLATLSPDEAFRYRRGMGFYAKEESREGGVFYWTQRRFAVRLSPGETLRIGLARFTPDGRPVELTAEADGRIVLRKTLEPGQAMPLRLAAGSKDARVIRFTLSRGFVPKHLGHSADRRELGLVAVFPGS